jgi:hypothetical protein
MIQGMKGRSDGAAKGEEPDLPPSLRRVVPSSLSWSIFLAISWTWCIGMYLPVLLVRDLGFWGWVVFAIPNVIGAAAMGWMLPTSQASRHLADQHREACVWFSIITIAFHVFFIGWMIQQLIGPDGVALAAIAAALTWVISRWRRDGDRWCAIAVLLISIALAIGLLSRGQLSLPSPHSIPTGAAAGLAALAPVCILGFFHCPYLDLTFHRARQHTSPAGGRWAFGLGFGFFFLLMILFTLGYALPLAAGAAGLLALCIGIHMALQSGFTIAAHLREILPADRRQTHQRAALGIAVLITALLAGFTRNGGTWFGLARPEIIYRAFMGFYGLIFPAYVWICMGKSSDVPITQHQTRRHLIFIIAILLAAPMFAMGFLARQWLWLWPGVAVVLIARYAAPFKRTENLAVENR